jgi:hypothetical protein
MNRWKVISLLYATYASYFSFGMAHSLTMVRKYELLAIQKADTNRDGKVDMQEAVVAYKSMGLGDDEVVRRINDQYRPEWVEFLYVNGQDPFVNSLKGKINPDGILEDIIQAITKPGTFYKGSELERYVKGEK